ncbi:Integrase core domain [Popillia japonica]|uniref:Integrase core domain n=1 Tax=Popillia japonica TaxID=7064 RepID=A0AAW1IC73_POPJA
MNGTKAKNTIEKLRCTFSYFGLPEELVSDNGPPFNGEEYKKFCKSNGITHRFSPPLHPCSNGLAERAVRTVKSILKKQLYENFQKKLNITIQHQLSNFLLKYRTTPTSVNGKSPAEMIFKQTPRTRLRIFKEKGKDKERDKRIKMNEDSGRGRMREFTENQDVLLQLIKNGKPNE